MSAKAGRRPSPIGSWSAAAAAEVVVAAGAGRFEHDLDLAGVAFELKHRLAAGLEHGEVRRPSTERALGRSSAAWSHSGSSLAARG
ncbi:MAG TPA: hypothetical protein VFB42_05280 [Gaiellaceae bacterium]|nr:hypothetical protein [Gaiellaceae bacterium]